MKTVRKDLSSEDKSRQIFRQNHQNYRHRGINPWQKQCLPICRFSGCKKSSRLRDTESWLDLMNLITCLIFWPSGERKFLLKSFYRNHEKVVGSGGLLMSYLKDYSLFSLLNSSKPMVQCTNERLEYLLSKVLSNCSTEIHIAWNTNFATSAFYRVHAWCYLVEANCGLFKLKNRSSRNKFFLCANNMISISHLNLTYMHHWFIISVLK